MSEPSSTSTTESQATENSSGYVVVARRYRPRNFDELVGQQHVGQALRNAIETNRVGHAYLFTGARGVGKTSTARIFAKALNCPGAPNSAPDQDSDISRAIDSGEDVDVIEIDGASNRGIDEIRSLRANAGVRPSRSRFKIYIIDEVHMLTTPAFNALLKTLEEPPEHVKFIFCTTDPEKIPITVLSRCQRFDFAPVELQEIVSRLRYIVDSEESEADESALELIARRAAGSMRDSQSLLEQVLSFSTGKLTAEHVHSMLGTANDERLHQLAHALASRDAAAALKLMDTAVDEGVDAGKLAEQLLGYFRDLMAVTVGCDASMLRHASASMYQALHELGEQWGLQTVLAVVGLIDQTLVRTRHSVYARVLLEATLIQICNLPDLQHIVDLAESAQQANHLNHAGSPTQTEKKNIPLNTKSPKQRIAPEAGGKEGQASSGKSPQAPPQNSTRPQLDQTETHVQSEHASSVQGQRRTDSDGPPMATPPDAVISNGSLGNQKEGQGDEKKINPSPPEPTQSIPWKPENVEKIWRVVIDQLESMTESLARMVERVEHAGPNRAKLHLSPDASLAKRRLDSTEHREAIMSSLKQLTGDTIHFDVILQSSSTQKIEPKPSVSKPSRMQRMREIENHQLIKDCLEVFDAEIVGIDKPR